MTGFILAMYPPGGGAPEFMPEGFGFTAHAHTTEREKAAVHATEESARRRGDAYRWPPAFWDCERRHRDRQERRFMGWRFEVEPVAQIAQAEA